MSFIVFYILLFHLWGGGLTQILEILLINCDFSFFKKYQKKKRSRFTDSDLTFMREMPQNKSIKGYHPFYLFLSARYDRNP